MAGQILEANMAQFDLPGLSKKELIGRNFLEFISPKEHAKAAEDLRKTLEEERSSERIEATLVGADGREFDAEVSVAVLRDSSGNPVGLICVGRDITERKRAQDAVRDSEEKMRSTVQFSRIIPDLTMEEVI